MPACTTVDSTKHFNLAVVLSICISNENMDVTRRCRCRATAAPLAADLLNYVWF